MRLLCVVCTGYKCPDLGCAEWIHRQKACLWHASLALVSLAGTSLGKWLIFSTLVKDTKTQVYLEVLSIHLDCLKSLLIFYAHSLDMSALHSRGGIAAC